MNTVILTVLGVLVVGVVLTAFTADGTARVRARKVGSVVGVSLLGSAVVAIVAGVVALIFMSALSSELEDAFSTDESSTSVDVPESTYEETSEDVPEDTAPSFGDSNEILPNSEEGWEQFCSPESGVSQTNRDTYCLE